jgi:hypothetical protein
LKSLKAEKELAEAAFRSYESLGLYVSPQNQNLGILLDLTKLTDARGHQTTLGLLLDERATAA